MATPRNVLFEMHLNKIKMREIVYKSKLNFPHLNFKVRLV